MKRTAYSHLLKWKNSPDRKPLLLQGARQTGKTWLMKEFGKNEYKNTVLLNFDKQPGLAAYFKNNISPERIIKNMEQHFNVKIIPEETLIILDEVQESARALNSLKYFYEDAPQYHLMAAGSFLGVTMHGGFPVGKVDRITLYPLSFNEFLDGTGKERFAEAINNLDFDFIHAASSEFNELLKTYFIVGGMPKAVAAYAVREDLREVQNIQTGILADYRDDFSKHISPFNIPKVDMIWNSIPRHLSKPKKKFVYKDLKEGARAASYEDAMNWLFATRLVYKITCIEENRLPLASYTDEKTFKLYMLDIGLYNAKSGNDLSEMIEPGNDLFSIFNGAMTEQFVMQELIAAGFTPYYWCREKGDAEVDFIIQWRNEIIPVEVKSGIRTKSKSLDVYRQLHNPKYSIRASLKNYGKKDGLYSIPLYMTASLREIINGD